MKTHTADYKNNLKQMGKEISCIISYTLNGTATTLNDENISNVNYHYEGNILKSVMRQLDFETFSAIPLGTEINYRFGVDVNGSIEYLNYGNFIVYSCEKNEDTDNYKIVSYDKMLYAMKDYEQLEVTYPITIKNYLSAICTKLGLTFANANDTFANYDKQIQQELYLDSEGNSLGYTFRDVLDEIAQATASTICINDNDELEIRYIDDAINETQNVNGTDLNLTNTQEGYIRGIDLKGDTYQYTTTGKNLLEPLVYNNPSVRNGITCTYDKETQTYKFNGTCTADNTTFKVANTPVEMTQSTTKVSAYWVGGSVSTYCYLRTFDSNYAKTTEINLVNLKESTPILTSTSQATYTATANGISVRFNNGSVANNFRVKFMIANSTNTDYELYTGNEPSPSPSYPQDIEVVTGRQEIDIVGKNLAEDRTLKQGLWCNSTSISNNSSGWYVIEKCLPNTTYTISKKNTTGTIYVNFTNIYPTNGATTGQNNQGASGRDTLTFTTPNNANYIFIGLFAGSPTDTQKVECIEELQLEKSNQATTYEPYKGQSYEINLGKNLFNKSSTPLYYASNMQYSATDIGCKLTTGSTGSGFVLIDLGDIKNFENKTLTFSMSNTANALYKYIAFVGCDNTGGNRTTIGSALGSSSNTLTTTIGSGYTQTRLTIRLYIEGGTSNTEYELNNIQLEKGSQATSYSPYFTPIELCKIGTYQDKIFKGKGVNLFDKDNLTSGFINTSNGSITTNANWQQSDYIKIIPSEKYTISNSISMAGAGYFEISKYDENKNWLSSTQYGTSGSKTYTYTNDSNTYYIKLGVYKLGTSTDNIQLEKGNQATTYEPYNYKDKWYIYKVINKYIANNDLSGNGSTTYTINLITPVLNIEKNLSSTNLANISKSNLMPTYFVSDSSFLNGTTASGNIRVSLSKDYCSDTATAKTYLTNNGFNIYYVSNTPTTEEITNSELVEQLNALSKAQTYEGITNISSSSPLSLTYVSDFETIDEELVKNTRASFDKKYSPINSLVLSRSADSDNIYIQDEASITENGLHELKIADNQILNGNNRDEYINEIFDRVNGLTYSYNDYESIGITYLDLCDRYRVSLRGNTYQCVMFNDEIEVNNGLNEIIYTDEAEESKTDYTKADKTDRRINQTYIIADKQQGQITALVNKTNNIDTEQKNNYQSLLAQLGNYATTSDVEAIQTEVEQIQTDSYTRTEIKQILKGTFYDEDNNQVVSEVVKTISGTFDENGMTYAKTNAKTSTTINESGVRVNNATSNQELLFAGYDDDINQTIVRTDNLTTRNFLVVGQYSRFQDYEDGTGVFDL